MVEVPAGTVLVSEYPSDEAGELDETAEPGWYALKDKPALSGSDITNPKQDYGPNNEPIVTFQFTGRGREAFQDMTRRIAQRGQASAIGPVGAEEAASPLRPLRGRPRQRSQDAADHQLRRKPRRDRRPHRRPDLRRLQQHPEAQDLATTLQIGALPINLKLISETQVSATLGSQALHDGIKAGIIGLASSSSSCSSTTASSA